MRWLSVSDVLLDHADVIIVGGGATGVGLMWDLTLRGLDVVLLEQGSLGAGTSGSFHGLLHSGARYAGTDPSTATECLTENRILRRVARDFVRNTGGVFVRLGRDAEAWEERWRDGCRAAGLRPTRISPAALRAEEPALAPDVAAAYRVPDAAIDGFGLLWSMAWSAATAGARIWFGARVVDFLTDDAGVRGVRVIGLEAAASPALSHSSNEPGEVVAPIVVNATGPWVRDLAALAGPQTAAAVPVEKDKGVMIVFNSRIVSTVVNRLRPPGDGDIFVPHGPVTILGTSSARTEEADRPAPALAEVRRLMEEGRVLAPALDTVAPLRTYAGVRPLLAAPAGSLMADGRERGSGRGFILIDHGQIGGPAGLVTLAGGKFTTFRAMAAAGGDLVVRLLGRRARCRTSEVGVPRPAWNVGGRAGLPAAGRSGSRTPVATVTGDPKPDPSRAWACECELVGQSHVLGLLDRGLHLSDLRRMARVGMGGCQGVFCGQRLAGTMWQAGWPGSRRRPRLDEAAIAAELAGFRAARLNGIKGVEWGTQARLGALARALGGLTLGEEDPGR